MKKSGDAFYSGRLTGREIIQLFREGRYTADTTAGIVYNARGQQLANYADKDGYLFIRLYANGKRKEEL